MTTALRRFLPHSALILLQFVFVALYISTENAVPFWDYAMYANMAQLLFAQSGFDSFWAVFSQSFAQNYNFLFALPAQLSFVLFGPSRDVFILTNFVFFFLLHEAAMAFLLRQLFRMNWRDAALWALCLCSLVPFMWYPLLQGYPDNGAAACLTFALTLSIRNKKAWHEALAVGALLALAVILRRHYAYPVIALLVALGGIDLFALWKGQSKKRVEKLKHYTLYYGCVGVALVFLLLAIEPSYVKEIVTTNYAQLYKSYERGALYFLAFLFAHIGLLPLLAVGAGYVFHYRSKDHKKESVVIVLCVFIVWAGLWALGPSQAGEHYLISVPPIFCIVGLYFLLRKTKWQLRSPIPYAFVVFFLGINSAYALWFSPFVLPTDLPLASALSAPRPPWVRSDIDELKRLAGHLARTTGDKDKIVVAGSSFVFNQDLVRALYTDVFKDYAVAMRFLPAPESDGQQEAPLDVLASANVYVVAQPPQYHLPPEGQKVVTSLVSRFPPLGNLAALFAKDPQEFTLINGVTVSVWRRKEWTPDLLHAQLKEVRQIKPEARLWIAEKIGGAFDHGTDKKNDEAFVFQHGAGIAHSSLFFDQPLEKGEYRVVFVYQASGSCKDMSFNLRVKNANGKIFTQRTESPFQNAGPFYLPFSIEGIKNDRRFLSLGLTTASAGSCTVALWQLKLERLSP